MHTIDLFLDGLEADSCADSQLIVRMLAAMSVGDGSAFSMTEETSSANALGVDRSIERAAVEIGPRAAQVTNHRIMPHAIISAGTNDTLVNDITIPARHIVQLAQ